MKNDFCFVFAKITENCDHCGLGSGGLRDLGKFIHVRSPLADGSRLRPHITSHKKGIPDPSFLDLRGDRDICREKTTQTELVVNATYSRE